LAEEEEDDGRGRAGRGTTGGTTGRPCPIAGEKQDDNDQQQDDDDAQQDASGSGASGSRSVYLRGPTSLPQRPILRDRRPLIRPDGERHVTLCSSFLFILCVQNHNIN
jgi:hypothetical protein